jgi:hypothetical protein
MVPLLGAGNDQVSMALNRIASHIGTATKFAKASALLRRLLDSASLAPVHGDLVFSALKAAMHTPIQAGLCRPCPRTRSLLHSDMRF